MSIISHMILDNDQSEAMILKVDPSEIQAIHRIPGKIGEARPVIVKLVNSEHNMGLITRLRNCKELESAMALERRAYTGPSKAIRAPWVPSFDE